MADEIEEIEEIEEILAEACSGIHQWSDQLMTKLASFVELGPDTNTGNCTRAFSTLLDQKLHELVRLLVVPDRVTVKEKAEIASIIFDILLLVDNISEGFSHIGGYLKYQRDNAKGERARAGKKALLASRDDLLITLADRLMKTKNTRWTPNALETEIKRDLSSMQERTSEHEALATLKDGTIAKRLRTLGYGKTMQNSGNERKTK